MSEIKEAVNSLKTFLLQVQGMQKVAGVLETIGNLEKAHADALTAISHYKKKEEEAKERAEGGEAKLQAIIQEMNKAQNEHKKVLNDFRIERQDIVNETEKEKEAFIKAAEAKIKEIEGTVQSKRKEAEKLDEEISKKKGELEKIHLETTRLKNNLESFIGK